MQCLAPPKQCQCNMSTNVDKHGMLVGMFQFPEILVSIWLSFIYSWNKAATCINVGWLHEPSDALVTIT